MYNINYLLKVIINTIFRYIPWLIIGILFCTINVNALELDTYTLPNDNTIDINHFYGSSSESLTYSITNSPIYASFLTSATTNNSVTIAHGLSLMLYSNVTDELLKYDNFSFIVGTNGIWNNSVSFRNPIGTCTMNSTTSDLTTSTNFIGYNFSIINCKVNKSFKGSYTDIRLPFTISSYTNNTNRFYISRLWNVWNDDTFNQQIIQQQQQTNNKLDEMNDNITSSDTDNDNVSNTLNNVSIGNEGVITQLITLPINLFTNVLNSINGNCTSFNLGNLYGTNLTLPCINIENIVGPNLWSIIDILFSGFTIFFISNKIKKIFEQLTNLREGDILDD